MKTLDPVKTLRTVVLASALATTVGWMAVADGDWNYGKHGADWHVDVDTMQSPIDLPAGPTGSAKLDTTYLGTEAELINNGHTWEVHFEGDSGGKLEFDGREFELVQFHFHSQSEHTREGKRYPLEVHLVHSDAKPYDKDVETTGEHLAVVSVLFEESPLVDGEEVPNLFLEQIWKSMPRAALKQGEKGPSLTRDASELLPENQAYQTYQGSLTTPPCSEHVTWIVINQTAQASATKIAEIRKNIIELAGNENYRAVQRVLTDRGFEAVSAEASSAR